MAVTHADALQQRCYLYVEQDYFAFEMKVGRVLDFWVSEREKRGERG